jgi:glycine cleavage system transcriptional repressor
MVTAHHVVLTAVGADRPGLVDEVARYVLERGGNLEDSRMVNLHGQFAMMMLVAGSDDVIARLRDGLGALRRDSHVRVELQAADLAQGAASAAAIPYRLNTWAMDHPGLVQSVAHLLSGLGVNIESADTSLRPAPYTNTPLFEMELVVAVPADLHVADLREALGRLCDELNIDWQLTAL